jgi:hypothetical protein
MTTQCHKQEPGLIERMTQGLSALVTHSGLGCCKSSRGRQVQPRLHEDEELIFSNETLPFDGRFNQRSPAPMFEEMN